MTYKDKLVVVVKHNGKILREVGDTVTLPFGSDYSLLFKNLESRRALVDVSIDGEDVLGGQQLIIDANDTTELKGFLTGKKAKNSFRFIKKTKAISKHRGDRIDDGIIRVEFRYEKKFDVFDWTYVSPPKILNDPTPPSFTYWNDSTYTSGGVSNCTLNSPRLKGSTTISCNYYSAPLTDEGITVKGKEINQDFQYGSVGALETNSSVIVLRLSGGSKRNGKLKKAKKPITVRTRLTCSSCGKKWRSTMKYCGNCSTYLR